MRQEDGIGAVLRCRGGGSREPVRLTPTPAHWRYEGSKACLPPARGLIPIPDESCNISSFRRKPESRRHLLRSTDPGLRRDDCY